MSKTVLLTGASGMIGSSVVRGMLDAGYDVIGIDRKASACEDPCYTHLTVDLSDRDALCALFAEHQIDRVIHLAALAHTAGESDLSYETYYRINVTCAKNVFSVAAERDVPVLFISTADVYGFVKGVATKNTEPKPVTVYGKTKYLAECELRSICSESGYDIFRFAPVYTEEIKRDIQKRYYLKAPNWAYIIGKGMDYEFLAIGHAVERLVAWVETPVSNEAFNVKDEKLVNTAQCLTLERAEGRAKHILHFPKWLISFGFGVIKCLTGKNKYTYLLNKAVHPLRTE